MTGQYYHESFGAPASSLKALRQVPGLPALLQQLIARQQYSLELEVKQDTDKAQEVTSRVTEAPQEEARLQVCLEIEKKGDGGQMFYKTGRPHVGKNTCLCK